MATSDSSFFAQGGSNDPTGVTAWTTPAGNISFDQGMLGIGVIRGVIGLIDDGTNAPPANLPPAASYTTKTGIFGGAITDTGAAGVSTARVGVFGQSGSANGIPDSWSCGVLGASVGKPGVCGWSNSSEGVYGQSNEGSGVQGVSSKGFGVYGFTNDKGGTGVFGAGSNKGYGYGVEGRAEQTGTGVMGHSGPSTALPLGFAPAGVIGQSTENAGVIGVSKKGAGVAGLSTAVPTPGTLPAQVPAGVHGESTNGAFGVLGVTASTATSPGAGVTGICTGTANGFGVFGYNINPAGYAGYFTGNLHVEGVITGIVKNAVVPFPDGSKRLLHCMESPEHWFEDFGSARLKNGRATVKLDADFAKVIRRGGYHVFLTPKGDCGGLYVRRQGGASFEVRELQGGRSSVAFCYRIVGQRKDIKAHKRFAKIDKPPMPPAQRTGRRRSSLEAMLARVHKQTGGNPAHRRKRA